MRILISNDDGVYAPGIEILAAELKKIAEVTVVAPDRDRSGASNSLSISVPIRLQHLPNGYISVTGTPTDCVHVALTGLMEEDMFILIQIQVRILQEFQYSLGVIRLLFIRISPIMQCNLIQ